jgi:hypothetical protein
MVNNSPTLVVVVVCLISFINKPTPSVSSAVSLLQVCVLTRADDLITIEQKVRGIGWFLAWWQHHTVPQANSKPSMRNPRWMAKTTHHEQHYSVRQSKDTTLEC